MVTRKSVLAALGATLALTLTMVVSADGVETANRTTRVTFSGPVALPGVILASGTYIFELAAPYNSVDIVIVRNRNRSAVYYMGFTEAIDRPARPAGPVALGEAPAGAIRPVVAWYPEGTGTGHRFLYPAK